MGLRRRTGPEPVYDDSKAWEGVNIRKDLAVAEGPGGSSRGATAGKSRRGSGSAQVGGPGASKP